MVRMTLTPWQVREAGDLADASYARWAYQPGHYTNSWSSHFIGKLGESATDAYARAHNLVVAPFWAAPELEMSCDLTIGRWRADVKTWLEPFWADLGRCVAVNQIDTLRAKADIVVWAVVFGDHADRSWYERDSVQVGLAGYSLMRDFDGLEPVVTGRAGMRQVTNLQMPLERMRRFKDDP